MSTKTTFKRVALVAVAALGFGVLSSVAPASALDNAIAPTAVSIGTIPTAQVGVGVSVPVTITAPFAGTGDTFTITVKMTSSPTGSAFKSLSTRGDDGYDGSTGDGKFVSAGSSTNAGVIAPGNNIAAKIDIASAGTTASWGTVGQEAQNSDNTATVMSVFTAAGWVAQTKTVVYVTIYPDVAGAYTALVSTHAGSTANTTYSGTDANATISFATASAASGVALSAVTGTSTTASSNGQLMKATISSAGVASQLASGESLTLTTNSTTARLARITANPTNGAATGSAATITLTNADFVNGSAYFYVRDTAAQTALVVTATGSGLLSSTIVGTATTSVKTAQAVAASTDIAISDGAATRPGSGHVGYAANADTASTTASSHSYTVEIADTLLTALAPTKYFDVKVTDSNGKLTGVASAVFNQSLTVTYDKTLASGDPDTATLTITGTLSTVGDAFTAVVADSAGAWNAADGVTVTSAAALVAIAPTVSPSVTVRGTVGGSVSYTVKVTDQFGAALANQSVTVTKTGRNASSVGTAIATDANGYATYTAVDAGTAATVSTTDTITFTGAGTAPTRTLVWNAAAVGTVTLLTGTEDDTAATVTYTDINASSKSGASAGAVSVVATVKDASGSILVGVPVTFSTTDAGAAVKSTSVTVYTGAAGTATASVYGWTTGTKTFTATAGGKSGTGTLNFKQNGADEVRTISAVASGSSIVVTAKDRFGNVVAGVPLYASRTGNGLFGGGSNTNGQTTDKTGTAEFIFNAGSADSVVTITAGSLTSAYVAYGQTSSVAGALCVDTDCTSAAFTATTVGTAQTAETGVGASLSPAGVGSVSVAIAAGVNSADTAADAAAEATDAANAATDAANAAAEAADAATAAAQDAADAVAALSAQVASLISGLKSQLTALTNLVIKIQKKVKA